ncbi:MAG TPA: hypothetical protein VGX78_04950 [Pirellulales bacterium]|jgi:hypothetical protein|nr:hypothetical protein [Pirellulales bacterium]
MYKPILKDVDEILAGYACDGTDSWAQRMYAAVAGDFKPEDAEQIVRACASVADECAQAKLGDNTAYTSSHADCAAGWIAVGLPLAAESPLVLMAEVADWWQAKQAEVNA